MALLLPVADGKCRKWFRSIQAKEDIDIEPGIAPRDLYQYEYWGKQLIRLKEVYDKTEPRTFKQWWFDKRKPNQRYTFWIAMAALIIALLFGLTQTITG